MQQPFSLSVRHRLGRHGAVVAVFLAGACGGTAALTVAQGVTDARPSIPPTAPSPAATVLALDAAEVRTAPPGTAHVRVLAHGQHAWLGRLDMAAGGKVPEHADPTEEFIHVLSGGGDITIDGQTRRIGPGSTVYMPAGARVSYQNGDEPMLAVQVFAGPAPAAKYGAWKQEK